MKFRQLLVVSLGLTLVLAQAWAEETACEAKDYSKQNDFFKDLEKDFFDSGIAARVLNYPEIKDCNGDGAIAAFLLGTRQGLSGERFAAFYQRGEQDSLQSRFACTEYGLPKNNNRLDYDYILENANQSTFLKAFDQVSDGAATLGKWTMRMLSFGYFFSENGKSVSRTKEFREALEAESARTAAQTGPLPTISIADLSKKTFKELTSSEKAYSCCMKGFLAGFTVLQERIKHSETLPCTKSAECKKDFSSGLTAAKDACTGQKCEGCELGDLLKKDKTLLVGCASAGFLDALRHSSECEAARSKRSVVQAQVISSDSLRRAVEIPSSASQDKTNPANANSAETK